MLILLLLWIAVKAAIRKCWWSALIHAGLAIVLVGALAGTHRATQGVIPLRPGDSDHYVWDANGKQPRCQLPFSITLNAFQVLNHPHTEVPSDFLSTLSIATKAGKKQVQVRVNHPHIETGWWLYQMSWGQTDEGLYSVIEASRDSACLIVLAGASLFLFGLTLRTLQAFRR
ncbi:MAG: cytochrome c biogenesis protein ResB [Kiritimatiellia bacterium]